MASTATKAAKYESFRKWSAGTSLVSVRKCKCGRRAFWNTTRGDHFGKCPYCEAKKEG